MNDFWKTLLYSAMLVVWFIELGVGVFLLLELKYEKKRRQVMRRRKISVLCLQETKWIGEKA